MALKVGDKLPSFKAKDTNGNKVLPARASPASFKIVLRFILFDLIVSISFCLSVLLKKALILQRSY